MKNSKDGTSHVLLPALRSVSKPSPHRLVTLASGSLSTTSGGALNKWRPVAGPLWVTTRHGSTQQHRIPTPQWAALLTPVSLSRPERPRNSTPWLPSSFQWNLLEHRKPASSGAAGASLAISWPPLSHAHVGGATVAPRRRSHEEERAGSVVIDQSAQRGSTWLFQFLEAVTRWERESRALGMGRGERWRLLRHHVHDRRQHGDDEQLSEWAWAEKLDSRSVTEVKRLFHSFLNALPDGTAMTTEADTRLEMEKIALRFLDSVVWLSVLSSRNLNVPAFVIGMNIWHDVCVFYNLFITRFVEEVAAPLVQREPKRHVFSLLSLLAPATIGKRYAPNPAIQQRWLSDVQLLHDNCLHALALPSSSSSNVAAKALAEETRAMQDVRYAMSLPPPPQRVRLPWRDRLTTTTTTDARKTPVVMANKKNEAKDKDDTTAAIMTRAWSGCALRETVLQVLHAKRQQLDQMTATEAPPHFLFLCEEVLQRCPEFEKNFQFVEDTIQHQQQQQQQRRQQQEQGHHASPNSPFEVLLSLAIERRAPLMVELAVMSMLLQLRGSQTIKDNSRPVLVDVPAVVSLLGRAAEVLQDPSLEDWNCLLVELFADKVSSKFGGRVPQGQLIAALLLTTTKRTTRPLYAMIGKTASYDPIVLLKFTGEILHQGAMTKWSDAASLRLLHYTMTVLVQDVLTKVPVRTNSREYDQEVLRLLFGEFLPSCATTLLRAQASTTEDVTAVHRFFSQCLALATELGVRWDFMVAPERRQHRQSQRDSGNVQRRLHDAIRTTLKQLQPQPQPPHWSVHGDNDYPFFLSVTPGKTQQLAQLVDVLLTYMATPLRDESADAFRPGALIPFMSAVHVVIREVDSTTGKRWEGQIVRITNHLLQKHTDADMAIVLSVLRSLSSLRFGGAQPVTVYTALCRAALWRATDAPQTREGGLQLKELSSVLTHTLRCVARNTTSSHSERVQEVLRVVAMASSAGVPTTSASTLEAIFQTLFYRRHTVSGSTLQNTAAHPSQPFSTHWWGSPVVWYRGLLSEEQWLPLLHDHFHVQRLVACALLAEGKVTEALTYIPTCDERVARAALQSRDGARLTPLATRGAAEALLGHLAKLHVALCYCGMDRTASSAAAAKQVARSLLDTAPPHLTEAWRATWRAWYQQSQPQAIQAATEVDDTQHIRIRPYGGRQYLSAVDRARQAEGELLFRFQPQSHLPTFEYDCCRQLANSAVNSGNGFFSSAAARLQRDRTKEEKAPPPATRMKIATEYLITISAVGKKDTN